MPLWLRIAMDGWLMLLMFKEFLVQCSSGRDGIVKGVHVGIKPTGLAEGFTEDLNKFIAGKSLKREE